MSRSDRTLIWSAAASWACRMLRVQRVDLALEVLEVLEALVHAARTGCTRCGRCARSFSIESAPTRDDGISLGARGAQLGLDLVGGAVGGAIGDGPAGERLARPSASLSRSNSWRVPSRLTTTSRAASTRS